MNISDYMNSVTTTTSPYEKETSKNESVLLKDQFHKAIKGYQDEYYTGLTDEEKEAIKKQQEAYLEAHPLRNKADVIRYNQFTKNLLKQYGFKGDYSEFLLPTEADDEAKASDLQLAYEQESSKSMASKERLNEESAHTSDSSLTNPTSINTTSSSSEKEESHSTIVSNPDGSQTLVLLKGEIIVAKFNIGEAAADAHDTLENVLIEHQDTKIKA